MSILLDALRKSENSQRQVEAPNLDSQTGNDSVTGPIPLASTLLVSSVALLVISWFVWHQYAAPKGFYRPPVTLSSAKTHQTNVPASLPVPQDAVTYPVKPQNVGHKATAQRTPVESFQKRSHNTSAKHQARRKEGGRNKKNKSNKRLNDATVASTGGAAKERNPGVKQGGSRNPGTANQKKFQPSLPEPIGYWELPDAIRADVPEIKFSVLVYDKQPENRFIMVAGNRLGQGDRLESGPEVLEIRRDGVLFSYRKYHFLVTR